MTPNRLTTHPGEILAEELLAPLGMSSTRWRRGRACRIAVEQSLGFRQKGLSFRRHGSRPS